MGVIVFVGELDILRASAVSKVCTVRAKCEPVTKPVILGQSVSSFDVYSELY